MITMLCLIAAVKRLHHNLRYLPINNYYMSPCYMGHVYPG